MEDESKRILFENGKSYEDCLQNDRFPIDNPEPTIYEKYQGELIDIIFPNLVSR